MLYKISGLRRVYGSRTVLSIDDLSIEKGKVYTLTGPNGAGKSTLLNILSFLAKPTTGHIEFLGEKVEHNKEDMARCRKNVVQLDQYPIMFSGTVFENVAYGLKIRKEKKAVIASRVAEMLDIVGMTKFAEADACMLSGGETKRVALARALAIYPEVLICDEPSANVDNENQEMILNALEWINKKRGTTIIFSTHYLSQGHRLADHTLLLQNGELSDVVNENVYRARVTGKESQFTLCSVAGSVHFAVDSEKITENVTELKIWLDPAKVTLTQMQSGQKEQQGKGELSGHIIEITRQKALVKVCVDTGVRVIVHLEYSLYRKMSLLIGDKVKVHIPQESIRCTGL